MLVPGRTITACEGTLARLQCLYCVTSARVFWEHSSWKSFDCRPVAHDSEELPVQMHSVRVKPVTLSFETLKRGRFRFLTISVLENSGLFDKSHISISHCQTPENNTFGFTRISQIHRCDVINDVLKGTCCDGLQKCFKVFQRTVIILLGGRGCDLFTTWRLRRIHRICLFPSRTYSALYCLPHTDYTGSREIHAGWFLAHSSARRMLPQLSIVGNSKIKRFKDWQQSYSSNTAVWLLAYHTQQQATDLGVSDTAEVWSGLSPSALLQEHSIQPCDRTQCDTIYGLADRQGFWSLGYSFSPRQSHSRWSHRGPLEKKVINKLFVCR